MIQLTAIRLEDGIEHKDIESFQWHELHGSPETQESSLETLLKFMERSPNKVLIRSGNKAIEVRVVDGKKPYVQAFVNGQFTDDLLELPRF